MAFAECYSLEKFEVAPDNSAFTSADGVLYSKDRSEILMVTGSRKGNFMIPNTVVTIGESAFYGCIDLTSISIPASVTSIGFGAFCSCNGLSSIYCQAITPPIVNGDFVSENTYRDCILYIPEGCSKAYKSIKLWRDFWEMEEMDFGKIDDKEIDTDNFQVSVSDGNLTISGIGINEPITIYDLQGRVVYSGLERLLPNIAHGIYILQTVDKTLKFSI